MFVEMCENPTHNLILQAGSETVGSRLGRENGDVSVCEAVPFFSNEAVSSKSTLDVCWMGRPEMRCQIV